ncbi:MAG: CehA/McbA family metallohydrolase [Anaerohalosphaeraceae bacterium]|nr:CehA/McbA family metallohydrolase [Anaerohalosphaeraceae bacterium]
MDKNKKRQLLLTTVLDLYKERMGERLRQSRQLFNSDIVIGDIHTHSYYSDGTGEVAELKKYADLGDLDFLFVTDHDTLDHKADCNALENVWLGQEPRCGPHHIGMLSPSSLFTPKLDGFLADWQAAKNLAPFIWIAHPTGWHPDIYYPREHIDLLFGIGESLAIEVLNGYCKISDTYDKWQAGSVELWDKLLLSGKKVTAVAGSDAHFSGGVGCVWTGVFGANCTSESVIKALNAGKTLASEAPILLLTSGETYPGETIKIKTNENINFKLRAADSLGLSEVRLIKNGKTIKLFEVKGRKLFEEEFVDKAISGNSYYRLECVSIDYKHGFTSPIYVEAE